MPLSWRRQDHIDGSADQERVFLGYDPGRTQKSGFAGTKVFVSGDGLGLVGYHPGPDFFVELVFDNRPGQVDQTIKSLVHILPDTQLMESGFNGCWQAYTPQVQNPGGKTILML